MRANHRQDFAWRLVEPVKEILCRDKQGLHGLKEFTMGHFAPKMSPQHFNGIEPGTVGWQVQKDQSSFGGLYHSFHLIVLMRIGIIPGDIDRSGGMLLHESFKEMGHLLATLVLLELHHRFARVIIHGSNAIIGLLLTWRLDHHLLAFGTPHGPQRGQPTQIELIGIVKHLSWL
jgi:hypothetical protein